jgi:cytochrome d ubiquinol oxidase subunit I
MSELLAARLQMATSLGFHIVFACVGVAMPFLMATAHWGWLRTKDPTLLTLTKAWSKGVAIFFAVGAVSGTALSFELGLLWPGFMVHAGPIVGMPFSWEGTAFFLEAIAIGVFLYGWDRIRPWAHWASGLLVGITGVLSALFVVCANGWMNAPAGFTWNDGHPADIDPWAAMFNAAAWPEGLHMVIAAFEAVGFAVAGLHALLWLRTRLPVHAAALRIALAWGGAPRSSPPWPATTPPRTSRSCNPPSSRRWRRSSTPSAARPCSWAGSRTPDTRWSTAPSPSRTACPSSHSVTSTPR